MSGPTPSGSTSPRRPVPRRTPSGWMPPTRTGTPHPPRQNSMPFTPFRAPSPSPSSVTTSSSRGTHTSYDESLRSHISYSRPASPLSSFPPSGMSPHPTTSFNASGFNSSRPPIEGLRFIRPKPFSPFSDQGPPFAPYRPGQTQPPSPVHTVRGFSINGRSPSPASLPKASSNPGFTGGFLGRAIANPNKPLPDEIASSAFIRAQDEQRMRESTTSEQARGRTIHRVPTQPYTMDNMMFKTRQYSVNRGGIIGGGGRAASPRPTPHIPSTPSVRRSASPSPSPLPSGSTGIGAGGFGRNPFITSEPPPRGMPSWATRSYSFSSPIADSISRPSSSFGHSRPSSPAGGSSTNVYTSGDGIARSAPIPIPPPRYRTPQPGEWGGTGRR